MRRYVAVIGIWMRLTLDKHLAPLPDMEFSFEHEHDIGFTPLIAFLGAQIPPDAQEHFLVFRGERQIEHVIGNTPRRVVTAWLGKERMIGGEFTSLTPPQSKQLHPATIHWRIDAERIGWVRSLYLQPIDARAERNRLELSTTDEIKFLISAPGASLEHVKRDCWYLPQLSVRVETNATQAQIQTREALFEIRYAVEAGQPITCILNCEGN
jgi:hypothetical protein